MRRAEGLACSLAEAVVKEHGTDLSALERHKLIAALAPRILDFADNQAVPLKVKPQPPRPAA